MNHLARGSGNTARAERRPECSVVVLLVLFVTIHLVTVGGALAQIDEKRMSVQEAVMAAEQYQRDMGVNPSQRRITVTSDMRQLKVLSAKDLEALHGVVQGRDYWIVYHTVDHRVTPSVRGQAVVLVYDSATRKLIHTLVK